MITASMSFVALVMLSGCAMKPTQAIVFSNTTSPYMATAAASGSKVGVSETCVNVLGIAAFGDCSISTAAKNGEITTISTVDWKGANFLTIFSSGTTIVTGE